MPVEKMIRELTEKDLDGFLKIRMDSLRLYPKAFGADPNIKIDREKTRLDLQSKNEENFILRYFDHDQIVGIAGFIRENSIKKKHKGFIWGVFVYPAYRGRGIGKKLLQACLSKIALLKGLKKVMLTVSNTSIEAIDLYVRLGFHQYGIEKDAMRWDGETIDEIYIEKLVQ